MKKLLNMKKLIYVLIAGVLIFFISFSCGYLVSRNRIKKIIEGIIA